MSKDSGGRGGIGFLDGLALLFIGLKLAGELDWPWVWVLAPLWGRFALEALVVAAVWAAAALEGRKRE